MARYTGPRVRVSRRLGFNVFENKKGDKALQDRPYPPGENGRKRMRETDYGTQLKEKQKVRYMYGIMEKQFRNYYKTASRMSGITGENLLILLESRLDNVVYRLGFASTRSQSRQLVSHAHFLLNNRKCNFPSASLKPGDVIKVRDKSKKLDVILDSIKKVKGDISFPWLEIDKAKMTGNFLAIPERDEMLLTVNEQLVVELYSK